MKIKYFLILAGLLSIVSLNLEAKRGGYHGKHYRGHGRRYRRGGRGRWYGYYKPYYGRYYSRGYRYPWYYGYYPYYRYW